MRLTIVLVGVVAVLSAMSAVVAEDMDAHKPALPVSKVVVRLLDGEATPLTDWIELTATESELYASTRGGRLVKGKVTGRDDKNGASFEVSGHKLAFKSKEYKVAASTPGPTTVLVTEYPGGGNLSLMYKLK